MPYHKYLIINHLHFFKNQLSLFQALKLPRALSLKRQPLVTPLYAPRVHGFVKTTFLFAPGFSFPRKPITDEALKTQTPHLKIQLHKGNA